MSIEKPNYYAILPANVRYDGALRPNAKLLYAEITALTNRQGFCTEGNAYFASLFELSKKTVSDLLSQLEKRGYIRVKVLRNAEKTVVGREIYIAEPILKNGDTSPYFSGDSPPKKAATPIPKKAAINKEDIINITKGRDVWYEYANGDDELLAALRDFELMRVKLKKPMTERARTLLLSELDKLAKDRQTKIDILYQSIVRCWTSVYPLKGGPAPEHAQGKPQSRRYEEW